MIVDKFKVGPYLFLTEFSTGVEVGGEIEVHVLSGKEEILSRTFYFCADKKHIWAFAQQFANDPAYRQTCLAGTAHWARVDKWFWRNNCAYSTQFLTIQSARMPQELKAMRLQHKQAEKQLKRLYELIENQIDYLEGTKEYQDHLRIEQQTPQPSMKQLDPEIEQIVQRFNQVSGVSTRFSCQGLRRGIKVDAWEYGPIWFPGKHEELAYIAFAELPDEFRKKLDEFVRVIGVGGMVSSRIEASAPVKNETFIRRLEAFLENL